MVVDHADADRVVVAVDRDVVQKPGWAGDPTEAKPGERERFRHRPDGDRPIGEIDHRHRRPAPPLIDTPVDLIAEQPGAGSLTRIGDRLQRRPLEQCSGRVVRVGERDDLRPWRDRADEFVDVELPTVLLAQGHPGDVRPERLGDRRVLLIARYDRHDMVTRLDQREVHELIRPDGTVGDQRVLPGLVLVQGGDGRAQTIGSLDRAVRQLHAEKFVEMLGALT